MAEILPRLARPTAAQRQLDRRIWSAGASFAAYGFRVGLRANRAEVLTGALAHLPHGWTPARADEVDALYSLAEADSERGGRPRYCRLYFGSKLVMRTVGLDLLYGAFERHAELLTAERAQGYLFVHAGVVGWNGEAILVPGRSMSGKTTLVRALVEAGAIYYSDEFAVLDPSGRVHPYPIPLSIRERAGSSRKVPIESLDGRVGREPLPVGVVLVTRYTAGAAWRPRALSQGRALLALMDNTVAARRDPAFAMTVLTRAVSGSRAVESRRGEAGPAVRSLFARLRRAATGAARRGLNDAPSELS
jgi:hypothetical protein